MRTSADLMPGDAFVIKEPLKALPLSTGGYNCPIDVGTVWVFKVDRINVHKCYEIINVNIAFTDIIQGYKYQYYGPHFELA